MHGLRRFLADENGGMWDYLIGVIVIGLGSTAILFGILAALRVQGGRIRETILNFRFGGAD